MPILTPGQLARIMHEGSIQVAKIPRREHWEASGQITYTSHWIGKTWNGDGLEAIVDPMLRLGSFENVVYSSRNGGSWLVLQRKRRPSMDGAHEAILQTGRVARTNRQVSARHLLYHRAERRRRVQKQEVIRFLPGSFTSSQKET